MLFQLSYEPQTAGAVGFEPTTFEVEARHSIQLSYTPVFFVNRTYVQVARNRIFEKILRFNAQIR